jgi:hypothetical protein
MRKIVLLLASLLWLGFWWWWYTCKITGSCIGYKSENAKPSSIEQESGDLLFNLNDSNTLIQPRWPFFRDSLINHLNKNQLIEIEGQYLAEEQIVVYMRIWELQEQMQLNYYFLIVCRIESY